VSRKPFSALIVSGAAAAFLSCCSSSAWAHGPFGVDTSVWTATYHLGTSPLSLAALIGLVLVLFGIREPKSIIAAALAAATAVLATALLPHIPPVVAPAAVILIGLSAVAGWNPPTAFSYILSAFAGLAAGLAADVDQPRWQDLIGMGATVLILTFWLLAASDTVTRSGRLQSVLPIARRVLGSWIAAIALLLGALAVLGKHA
jgi:hypothetical protein